MPVILAFGRLRQEDLKFQVSLGYESVLKKNELDSMATLGRHPHYSSVACLVTVALAPVGVEEAEGSN